MKLNIKRLRERDQYIWNLNGDDSKLKINGTTFRPTSKALGHNLEQAIVKAEELNKQFARFKQGLTPATAYTFKWCIQEFKTNPYSQWNNDRGAILKLTDKAKATYQYSFDWLEKIDDGKFIESDSRKFGKSHVAKLYEILKKGRLGDKVDAKTSAKQALEHLRSVMTFLKSDELAYPEAINMFTKLGLKQSGNDERNEAFATPQEYKQALDMADSMNKPQIALAIDYAYTTMCRTDYIPLVQWNKNYFKNYLRIVEAKNNSESDFPLYDENGESLCPEFVKRLENAFANKKGLYLIMRKQVANSHGYKAGEYYPYTRRYLGSQIKEVLDACKKTYPEFNQNLVFKSFRKGAISDLQGKTTDKNVMILTRHKDPKVLATNYLNRKDKSKAIAVSKIRNLK